MNERAELSLQIGVAKGGRNTGRPRREAEVLANVAAANQGPLSAEAVRVIFRAIIAECRSVHNNQ